MSKFTFYHSYIFNKSSWRRIWQYIPRASHIYSESR